MGANEAKREAYPMDVVQVAINMVDEIGQKLENLEVRLAVVSVPPVTETSTQAPQGEQPKEPERSMLMMRLDVLHNRLGEVSRHVNRVTERLDL